MGRRLHRACQDVMCRTETTSPLTTSSGTFQRKAAAAPQDHGSGSAERIVVVVQNEGWQQLQGRSITFHALNDNANGRFSSTGMDR